MAWRCGSLPRSLISTARSSTIRRSTTTSFRPPSSPPLSGHGLRPGPTSSIPTFRSIGGVIGCTQSLLPLHSVVAAARLTCHISVQARACCELSQVAKPFTAEKYLKKIGLGKDDYYFWKQIGKALLCTYTVFGAMWLFNETSPLGWWTLKPVPKEEKELAHLYQRINYPYPGDEEAMTDFIAKGGMIGTLVSDKGTIEMDQGAGNYQKQLQKEKFDQEANKLWLRMKNEVVQELREKGYDL